MNRQQLRQVAKVRENRERRAADAVARAAAARQAGEEQVKRMEQVLREFQEMDRRRRRAFYDSLPGKTLSADFAFRASLRVQQMVGGDRQMKQALHAAEEREKRLAVELAQMRAEYARIRKELAKWENIAAQLNQRRAAQDEIRQEMDVEEAFHERQRRSEQDR